MPIRNGKIFIVISLQGVAEQIREAIDDSNFDKAKRLSYMYESIGEKIQSIVRERGGYMHLFLADRQVLEVAPTVAEDIPGMLENYAKDIAGPIAMGMGLSFREAVAAMHASTSTGEIEMYDPENPIFEGASEYVNKAERPFELPVNMFHSTIPKPKAEENKNDFVSKPGIKDDIKMQSALIQSMLQLLQGNQAQQQQQQQAMMQQQGQQSSGGPRDLREALEGKQVEGYSPEDQAAEKQSIEKPQQAKQEPEEKEKESHEKLDALLGKVKESLPQIMALHDKNPEAYKAAMALVQKIVLAAKHGQTKKAEDITEDLEKAISARVKAKQNTNTSKRLFERAC